MNNFDVIIYTINLLIKKKKKKTEKKKKKQLRVFVIELNVKLFTAPGDCVHVLSTVCLGLIPVSVPTWLMCACVTDLRVGEIVIRLGGLLIRRAFGSRDVLNGGESKHSLLGNAAVGEQGNTDLSIYRTI